LSGRTFDLAIIGGGIHGCAIARDAAGRGLSVFLCEQGDLGSGASAASTKLLDRDFARLWPPQLARSLETQAEQEVLLRAAPHVVRQVRLVLPQLGGVRAQSRRFWLFTRDRVGRRKELRPLKRLDLAHSSVGKVLAPSHKHATELSACMADDTRLVILNALDAKARGASINPRMRCVMARREGWFWKLELEASETGESTRIAAKALVNATGAWSPAILDGMLQGIDAPPVNLIKSSHLIVRRSMGPDRGYAFPARDGQMIFVTPFSGEFALIGPWETDYSGDPGGGIVEPAEVEGLLRTANTYLRDELTVRDIAWTFAAVRAEPARSPGVAGRAPSLVPDMPEDQAPLVSIVGGDIAGHRLTAERALQCFAGLLSMGKKWTAAEPLPGGHFSIDGLADLVRALRAAYPFVAEIDAERLAQAYGTRAANILSGARRAEDLGRRFGAGLTEAEVTYLMSEEWARTAADVLWRRSKLGLFGEAIDAAGLDQWMAGVRLPVAMPAA
jgi:glycerol-3-phosphate dehydrogenase